MLFYDLLVKMTAQRSYVNIQEGELVKLAVMT